VLAGLRNDPKRTPTKLLYDAHGSELFEEICRLPEYYLTRVEMALLREHAGAIAAALGSGVTLIEPGAGAAHKVRLLLEQPRLAWAYFPVDVAGGQLRHAAATLRRDFPGVHIRPIVADFTRRIDRLPIAGNGRRVVFFPGSTLGNFTPGEARDLLAQFRTLAGPEGSVLVSMDHCKTTDVLLPAYDDAAGVTARFNLNVLHHLNRAFGANFRPERFRHVAAWSEDHHRVEMHLVSRRAQQVCIGPHRFDFAEGEILVTEYSWKPMVEEFEWLAAAAGLTPVARWFDARHKYGIYLLR
jgi:dimethylhistidine N-methyltransferase